MLRFDRGPCQDTVRPARANLIALSRDGKDADHKTDGPRYFCSLPDVGIMAAAQVGRNDPCPCGSGKKYKKCHGMGQRTTSTLGQHKLHGKTLTPPLLGVPKMQPMHWMDERLPEVLWAALFVTHFPRDYALSVFRKVAVYFSELHDESKTGDVTFSALAELPPEKLEDFLHIITAEKDHKDALSPLLLLKELPGRVQWGAALAGAASVAGWDALALAVARTVYHQSEEATDCRWLKVIAKAASGKLLLPSSGFGPEVAKEIENYPYHGDMAKVRPSVRAMEGAVCTAHEPQRIWPAGFWEQCLRDTGCFPLGTQPRPPNLSPGTDVHQLNTVWSELVAHSQKTTITTAADARHDTVFGLALFCLAILQNLLRVGSSQSILGRAALRSLVEAYITLAYLLKMDQPDLWKSHRVFGAGQAKLAFLKLEEADRPATSIALETLEQLANEDVLAGVSPY